MPPGAVSGILRWADESREARNASSARLSGTQAKLITVWIRLIVVPTFKRICCIIYSIYVKVNRPEGITTGYRITIGTIVYILIFMKRISKNVSFLSFLLLFVATELRRDFASLACIETEGC